MFHPRDQRMSGRSQSQMRDAANVFYRGALSVAAACKGLGEGDLFLVVKQQADAFGALADLCDLPPHLQGKG